VESLDVLLEEALVVDVLFAGEDPSHVGEKESPYAPRAESNPPSRKTAPKIASNVSASSCPSRRPRLLGVLAHQNKGPEPCFLAKCERIDLLTMTDFILVSSPSLFAVYRV